MRLMFYPKLALVSIRKNKRLYLPYFCTCIGMVMIFYIVAALVEMDSVANMPGGAFLSSMLSFGSLVIAIFSLIFLSYTNSFLFRRRKREFGLYNILGMGKGNLGIALLWETLITLALSLGLGLGLGIALSKVFELGLLHMVHGQVNSTFSVAKGAVSQTVAIYSAIFLVLMVKNLVGIHMDSPAALLHSENTGEKPPRANWFLALAGIVILAGAYYLAVTVQNPADAFALFFVAVVMVIVATYLLFISGSVTLCRFLQRRKGYYYKANHFVSVSSMAYRMKRNGAGLASICILATMVLVIVSSTFCLYLGQESQLQNQYPSDISVEICDFSGAGREEILAQEKMEQLLAVTGRAGAVPKNPGSYFSVEVSGLLRDGELLLDHNLTESINFSDVVTVYVVPLEDYNSLQGTRLSLEPGQAVAHYHRCDFQQSSLRIGDRTFEILDSRQGLPIASSDAMVSLVGSVVLVVPDFRETARDILAALADQTGTVTGIRWHYDFDLDLPEEAQLSLRSELEDALSRDADQRHLIVDVDSRAAARIDFYAMYGGLLFLGAMLSVVFAGAAVLIIYYKQLCEGYEDQARFAVMQKVGMTAKDIRRSVNSQMLTVFFLPLLTAGLHLAFAFPMVSKLLATFGLMDQRFLVAITAGSFLVFSLIYLVVYRITSNAYYTIVNNQKD